MMVRGYSSGSTALGSRTTCNFGASLAEETLEAEKSKAQGSKVEESEAEGSHG